MACSSPGNDQTAASQEAAHQPAPAAAGQRDPLAPRPPLDGEPFSAWLRYPCGPLELRYRPHSYAAQEIGTLGVRFVGGLAAARHVLGLNHERLPPIVVYITDPPSPAAVTSPIAATDAANTASTNGTATAPILVATVVHAPEAPCVAPEVDILRLLLSHHLGPSTPQSRFWDEGLIRYMAGRADSTPYETEADERCRQWLAEGLLPQVQELVAEADDHVSTVALTAAGAFAAHLIRRYGSARYLLLLQATRQDATGPDAAFSRVFRRALAVADRDWRRRLEATARVRRASALATVRRLLPLLGPYWWQGLTILFYALVGIAFSLALPLTFRFLIDDVLGHRPLGRTIPFVGTAGHVISTGGEQLNILLGLLGFLGALYVVNAGARLRLVMALNRIGEAFVLDLRRQLLERLSRLPATYFARTSTADVNQRVIYDTAAVEQAMVNALIPMVTSGLSILLNGVVLVGLEPRLALVAMVGLPILGLLYRLRRRNLRAAARERARRVSNLSARVGEMAAMQTLIKIYGAGEYFVSRMGRQLDVHRHLNVAYAQESSALGQSAALVMHLTQVLVLLTGGYLVIASEGRDLGAGGLAAFYVLLGQVFTPVSQVAAARQSLTDAGAAVERVAELLAEPPEADQPGAVEVGPLLQQIRFEGVNFGYSPVGPPVLREISLHIRAGQTVAFVGPTGAGKSSIVNLLPRLYSPTTGRISWDGTDVQAAGLVTLRRQIALVPQDALLLSTTVYENIRFGLEGVTEADVECASRLALAHEFISELPDGYDTAVGERGAGLSGGQRQRVALARALLRDPSVLIIDEATSALDATTQRAVQLGLTRRLRDGQPPRTVIKIAHRLETVADADMIFVLDNGRLVEQGRHAELVANDGLYAQLVADQVGTLASAGGPSATQVMRWLVGLAPFANLPTEALSALAGALVRIERRAGDEVYALGSPTDELLIVGRGRVEILTTDEDGAQQVINTIAPGQVLSLTGFLQHTPHTTSARAASDAVIFRLTRAAYEAIIMPGAEKTAAV